MSYAPHPVFHMAPYIGFDVGTEEDQQHRFVLARQQNRPADWQGGRDIIQHRIPNSKRTLRQDMGATLMTLTTTVLLPNKQAFQQFWENQIYPGTFRMQADWTMYRADRERMYLGVTYAEWDNVSIDEITDVTFDMRGVGHCTVTFSRGALSW